MLEATLIPSPATAPSHVRRLTLQPATAGGPANPFAPTTSDIAQALVRDAPQNVESRRPVPAPFPAAARYGLD